MRIAVIGTGIAGMTAAYLLAREHELTVFEAGDYIGGHTNTVDVPTPAGPLPIDTGFIVFNDRTYPNFEKLLGLLQVAVQPSDMSFSVRCERTGLEYNGSSLNGLFAQRRNMFRPSFYRMLRDILRFNRQAPTLLERPDDNLTMGAYLRAGGYRQEFIEHYLVPMGAAIWSAQPSQMFAFPAAYFVRFFQNHGFLNMYDRPRWQTIRGGARQYVRRLTQPFQERIRLRTPVAQVRREHQQVLVRTVAGETSAFDHIVVAAHGDQALRLLADPSDREREVLGAFAYQENEAVLHTDTQLLPRARRAWASWNYHVPREASDRATVTYHMNQLQSLPAGKNYCVTLNRTAAIRPEHVLRKMVYHHPVYTPAAVVAQRRWEEINGVNRTYFCGAYWGYGFHEDGVVSGLKVAARFGLHL
jgi:predicted NAD/FAD-binding protein